MRKVLIKKRKYSYKDILRVVGFTVIHYAAFNFVVGLAIIINYLINDKTLIESINKSNILIFYMSIIAPAFSVACHMIYSERGLPWIRAVMWIHDFGIGIAYIALEVI